MWITDRPLSVRAGTQLERDTGKSDVPSVLHQTWLPWVAGVGSAALLLILILLVCWCLRHRCRDKLSLEEGLGPPTPLSRLVPRLDTRTSHVQPPGGMHSYVVPGGVVTVTPQISTRSRPKGLLESRRGSNTSLTLSLSPSVDSMSAVPPSSSPSRERNDLEYLTRASEWLTPLQLRVKLRDNAAALFKEFWEIPMNHAIKRDVPIRAIGIKNRYQTIIPNESTRVVLPEINGDPLSTYVNANYIRGYNGREKAFIATQGPMTHTIIDFWRMVWHTHSPVIVMITNLVERNKRKCENYLPQNGESENFGPIHVYALSCVEEEGFSVRQLVLRCEEEERTCVHLWFPSWPDHATPTHIRQLIALVESCEHYSAGPDEPADHRARLSSVSSQGSTFSVCLLGPGPVVVHCSAGLGRTGCFIGLCIGREQLRREGGVDVLGIVAGMRMDRGGLVQTNEQYEFIHKSLATLDFEEEDEEGDGNGSG